MNKAVADDCEKIVNDNGGGLDEKEPIATSEEEEEEFFDALEEQESVATSEEQEEEFPNALEKQESVATLEEQEEEFFDALEEQDWLTNFSIPLSIFHYKGYNSDFFTSWYNISSEIFKEINRACPEKKVLNLALSVLMLPYIAFTALGLVIYNRFKTNKASLEEKRTKQKKVK